MDTPSALSPARWQRTAPEVQTYMRELDERLVTCEALLQTLQAQGQTLQEQLNLTSRNSSRPPSSDPPQAPRARRARGQRRRGGQPGHPGHTRALRPVDEGEEVVVLKPGQCCGGQAPLTGDDPTPFRHQVFEIPPIKPVLTE